MKSKTILAEETFRRQKIHHLRAIQGGGKQRNSMRTVDTDMVQDTWPKIYGAGGDAASGY